MWSNRLRKFYMHTGCIDKRSFPRSLSSADTEKKLARFNESPFGFRFGHFEPSNEQMAQLKRDSGGAISVEETGPLWCECVHTVYQSSLRPITRTWCVTNSVSTNSSHDQLNLWTPNLRIPVLLGAPETCTAQVAHKCTGPCIRKPAICLM